jgi:hypothetical protein
MKNREIEALIYDLDWNLSIETQNNAINSLVEREDYDLAILMQLLQTHKELWKNAAQVLVKKGYNKIKNHIDSLFKWLKDINWPGALLIFDFLRTIPKKDFDYYTDLYLSEARKENDEDWELFILQLIKNK